MKKLLRLSSLLVTAVLLAFSAQKSYATHLQGGDLTYACIAPNVFVVTMKVYTDCSGASAPTTASLNMRSPGCNAGRNQTMNQIGQVTIGDPYCPSIPKTCASGALVNYRESVFKTTVTFSATEAQCADWYFSWTQCCRPSTRNLTGQGDLYLEAYVKLFTPNAPGATPANIVHNNSSPEFNPLNIPIPFVCVNQEVKFSLNAIESDGDSLSYELVSSLESATVPATYSPIGQGGGTGGAVILNPNPLPPYNTLPPGTPGANPQFAFLPVASGNFSPTYPVLSYIVNWNAINPTTQVPYNPASAAPYFLLDPLTGEISFRPSVFTPSPSNQGLNKYAVVVKITEWRKVNGVMVDVGYIRRDIFFIVEDCSGNTIPTTNPQPTPPAVGAILGDTVFKVQTCTTTRLVLDFVDPDTADAITVFFQPNVGAALPNGNFRVIGNGTKQVKAIIDITPLPSDVGKNYFIPVRIEDNSCPLKGVQTEVFRIEVIATNRADILDDTVAICKGESLEIKPVLNRPDSILGGLANYQWEWEAAPGLNPADRNKRDITVTPTQDTWYRVTVRNASLNGCFDYDSVLVRVQPNPVIKDVKIANAPGLDYIIFGRSGQINVIMEDPNPNYIYSWSPGKDLSDSTIANPIASPLKTTNYTLTVTSEDGECIDTRIVEVKIGPFFLPNVITPNNDGKNDAFEYKGIMPGTSLKIYNRWGVLIKEYSSYDNSFKGEGVSDGTYYYMMQEPNGGKSYKGWFDIVRD